jgi:homogentisate 1,2-dioxygenase
MVVTTTFGASAQASFGTAPTPQDPYRYQVGFGNRFATEAIPGTLPHAQNTPQKCKYNLYSEQLNGSPFISTRASLQHAWFYRIRPSVAIIGVTKRARNPELEANFSLSNPRVQYVPQQFAWDPFLIPSSSESVDFVDGLKTIGGQGDPTLYEGLAVHIYTANASMGNRAYCSNDGDMLILPQLGRLDVQTEYGRMMVRPGELVVIQAGIRFKVILPDGPVRGYIQEVFGCHYELPELGPVGSNGMALPRDFEIPVASFDIDQSPWEIVYKFAGELYSCKQNHTPFDVVAWHGTYAPYKYAMEKFVTYGPLGKDQADPTISCILLAKSKIPGISISEFLAFTPKWSVTSNTFRPPYYHRNTASEVMGLIYGKYGGSSHVLEPGGLSYEASFMPHGETYKTFKEASTVELTTQRVCEDSLAFMFHISFKFCLTEFALERSDVLHRKFSRPPIASFADWNKTVSPENQWDDLQAHFMDCLDNINSDLRAAGLPILSRGPV